jgi:hypothetical protein
MKRYLPALSCLLSISLFAFLGCDTPTDPTTGVPSIKKVVISDSAANLANGVEKDTFSVDDTVYFAFSATDTDLDIKQAVLLQKSDTQTISPETIDLPEQYMESQAYSGSVKAEYAGNWTIQVYLIDTKGNKSNTISKNITINGYETYSVSYVLGADAFIEKYKDNMQNYHGIAPIDANKYKQGKYVYLQSQETIIVKETPYKNLWNTKSDGSGVTYDNFMNSGFYMPDHNVTLYAIWPEELLLYGGPKPYDPLDYGVDPYVPEIFRGTWSSDAWGYLHPETINPNQYSIGVIMFSDTTATEYTLQAQGLKLIEKDTYFVQVDADDLYVHASSEKYKTRKIYGRFYIVQGTGTLQFYHGYHNTVSYDKVE